MSDFIYISQGNGNGLFMCISVCPRVSSSQQLLDLKEIRFKNIPSALSRILLSFRHILQSNCYAVIVCMYVCIYYNKLYNFKTSRIYTSLKIKITIYDNNSITNSHWAHCLEQMKQ
jgi:hypothetical protein